MLKKKPAMIGREPSLATAVALVESGSSVDIVGGRGSGRSAYLRELEDRLLDWNWNVITVRGVASLKTHALAAMHVAGITNPQDTRAVSAIQKTADALAEFARTEKTVLFLDDWDDLDEPSWGVAQAVRRRHGLPIVLTRLQGMRARHTPSGSDGSTAEPAFVIELSPLKFDELEQLITAHLGGPIEPGTISRVYAKSGGIAGIALGLVDAAAREGCIQQVGGVWLATRDLWSHGLRGMIEAHLEALDPTELDALEVIALVGAVDTGTVRRIIEWQTLERLEERALVRFHATGGRQLVTVFPPLVTEFFRHEPLTARRIRLTEHITAQLGADDSVAAILAGFAPTLEHAESDAVFARLVQERVRTRRLVTHAEWKRKPVVATAVPYIQALIAGGAGRELIETAFTATELAGADDRCRVAFGVLHAEWLSYVHGDVDAALDELAALAAGPHPFNRLADAASVVIETTLRSVPSGYAARLDVTDDLPPSVRGSLWEAQLLVMLVRGEFSNAAAVFERLRENDAALGRIPTTLHGLLLLGQGEFARAVAWSTRGFDEAVGALDLAAARGHAFVASLCLCTQGNYGEAEKMIDTVFAAGDQPLFSLASQVALLNMASVIAVRRGNGSLGERYSREMRAVLTPDGPLPGQARAWADGQLAVFAGNTVAAVRAIVESSDALWKRGALFSAALGYLAAAEIQPDVALPARARERITSIDGEFVAVQLAYVDAMHHRDPDAMIAAIPRLAATGRLGHAISACTDAAAWLHAARRTEDAAALEKTRLQLESSHHPSEYDTVRFRVQAVRPTDRELEVGRLVSKGLTNQQIAARLVLSVRTVESHIHRLTRKIGATSRAQLKEFVDSHDRC